MHEHVCLYAGSFDPITLGHMDMIERARAIFDRVIVAVSKNPDKRSAFSLEERMQMIQIATQHMTGIEVVACEGLTVEFAVAHGAHVMLRGLRAVSDFEGERSLAQINRAICSDVETLFLIGKPEHSHISSSGVREMASYGCSLEGFVPEEIENMIHQHYGCRERNRRGEKEDGRK